MSFWVGWSFGLVLGLLIGALAMAFWIGATWAREMDPALPERKGADARREDMQ